MFMRDGIKTTSGRLFTIVGPSGCGKDSILNALQPRLPSLKVAKRVITRPKNGGDEDHVYLCQRLFDRAAQDGSFLFKWHAHGLSYGVPTSILDDLKSGHDVLFNGSRHALADMQIEFPDLTVIWVTVSIDILASRLANRGRETDKAIKNRLERYAPSPPKNAIIIDNSGALSGAVDQLVNVFRVTSH